MKKKIIIIDDDTAIRLVFIKALEDAGFTIYTASSSEEALKILEYESIHVFFIDLKLPGMGGRELCHNLRQERPYDCIYAMSGYTDYYDGFNFKEAGFDNYLVKPFKVEELVKMANEAFEKLDKLNR